MERFKEASSSHTAFIEIWIKNTDTVNTLYESLKKLIIRNRELSALPMKALLKVLDKDKRGTTIVRLCGYITTSIDGLVWFDYQEGKEEGPMEYWKILKVITNKMDMLPYMILKEEKKT